MVLWRSAGLWVTAQEVGFTWEEVLGSCVLLEARCARVPRPVAGVPRSVTEVSRPLRLGADVQGSNGGFPRAGARLGEEHTDARVALGPLGHDAMNGLPQDGLLFDHLADGFARTSS